MAELADAAHAAAEHGAEGQTVQEYITHHLSYLTYGRFPDGHWGLAHTPEEATEMGFMAIHVDTMGWSLFLGAASFAMLAKELLQVPRLVSRTLSKAFSNLSRRK
jgi:hypothetical protein